MATLADEASRVVPGGSVSTMSSWPNWALKGLPSVPRRRVGPPGCGELELVGAEFGAAAVLHDLSAHRHRHPLKAPARSEGRDARRVHLAQGIERPLQPGIGAGGGIVAAAAHEDEVDAGQIPRGQRPVEQVEYRYVDGQRPEDAQEGGDLVRSHGVVGVAHLEEQAAERLGEPWSWGHGRLHPGWPAVQTPGAGVLYEFGRPRDDGGLRSPSATGR